jgi:HAD superfamily hydrolase (TIGR01450 family)
MILSRRFREFVLDIDGVLCDGDGGLPHASASVARLRGEGKRVVFVTNNCYDSREEIGRRLRRAGIGAEVGEIFTPVEVLNRMAGDLGLHGQTALVIGSDYLRAAVEALDVRTVSGAAAESAAFVILSIPRRFGYEDLTTAMRAVRRGARLLTSGAERRYLWRGEVWPGTGALAAAVEHAAAARAQLFGKPTELLRTVLREISPCVAPVMIGDDLEMDIEGAARCGIRSVLVLTGLTTRQELQRSAVRPDFLASSLADLFASPTAGQSASAARR